MDGDTMRIVRGVATIIAGVSAAATVGCAARPEARPVVAPPVVEYVQSPSQVVQAVEKLRGLTLNGDFKIEVADSDVFQRAVNDRLDGKSTVAEVEAERALWLAFDLGPPDVDPIAEKQRAEAGSLAGFYDPRTKQLFVKRESQTKAQAALAHELQHALQHQRSAAEWPPAYPGRHELMALRSLREGDAMLTIAAYLATAKHQDLATSVVKVIRGMDEMSIERLADVTGLSPELQRAPRVVKEERLFPYVEGTRFVGEIYRAGGFALVDRLFEQPPVSTEQVLHPARYVAGELPVPVHTPTPPEGWRVVASGQMGELGTRVALSGCVKPSDLPGERNEVPGFGWGTRVRERPYS